MTTPFQDIGSVLRERLRIRPNAKMTRGLVRVAARKPFKFGGSTTFPLISHVVIKVSDDFARRGSPFLLLPAQPSKQAMAAYEIRPSGNPNAVARVELSLEANGFVIATTTANGTDKLPDSVPLDNISAEWVEEMAADAMIAVLSGNRMKIPE